MQKKSTNLVHYHAVSNDINTLWLASDANVTGRC